MMLMLVRMAVIPMMMLVLVRMPVIAMMMLMLVGMAIVTMVMRMLVGMTVSAVVMRVLVGMVRPGERCRCAQSKRCDGCQDGLIGIGNGHSAGSPVNKVLTFQRVIFS